MFINSVLCMKMTVNVLAAGAFGIGGEREYIQGCYATWRTWKSQGIRYLTEKSGNFIILLKILEKSGNLRILMLEAIFMPTLKPNFSISYYI